MKSRAFVVMPFEKKTLSREGSAGNVEVDFNRVYEELIKPALDQAGCEVFRADSEAGAGDIRTDMFFELVTADVVVADLSAPNPNVYYELGIRDGVCAHGVFIVDGGWAQSRPFDVATDRAFRYRGELFKTSAAHSPHEINGEKDRLARLFGQALAADARTTGSPLYSHLPGLRPVDWECIDTTKARYFTALRDDWEKCVRLAEANSRPGHILTLADDAPTRLHRTRILKQAVRSLIGLCRFIAAAHYAAEVATSHPDDIDAQVVLTVALSNMALSNCGDLHRADEQMQKVLSEHKNDRRAGWLVGMVYRDLWFMQWREEQDEPKAKARQSAGLLASAIRSFCEVQQSFPDQYLAGYNALLLMRVLDDLFANFESDRPQTPAIDINQLRPVVEFSAIAARRNSEGTADSDMQFWSRTALAGLAMLAGDKDATLRGVEDACSLPGTTSFHLQSLMYRLAILKSVGFRPDVIDPVRGIVERALQAKAVHGKWGKVALFSGHCPHLTGEKLSALRVKIDAALDKWQFGAGDLALCAGMTHEEITFAEACLSRGAKVRLLLLEKSDAELAFQVAKVDGTAWNERHSALLDKCEVWFHSEELGQPLDPRHAQERHNRWLLNTALMEAEHDQQRALVCGLFLWDGQRRQHRSDDVSTLASCIAKADRYRGQVERIDPASLAAHKDAAVAAAPNP